MGDPQRELCLVQLGAMVYALGKLLYRAELHELNPKLKHYLEERGLKGRLDPADLIPTLSTYLWDEIIPTPHLLSSEKQILHHACFCHQQKPGDLFRRAAELAGEGAVISSVVEEGYRQTGLRSIFPQVELTYAVRSKVGALPPLWTHELKPIAMDESLHPVLNDPEKPGDLVPEYRCLWEDLERDLRMLLQDLRLEHLFLEIYYLVQKYTWAVPRDMGSGADISLFDHLKLSAAFAGCLKLLQQGEVAPEKELLLAAADISGIQDFLFRLARAAGVSGISKRLRGRSFYLTMLSEILARHLVSRAGLTVANLLFCGGGNLEVLLPNTESARQAVAEVKIAVNSWLLQEFGGELQMVLALIEVSTGEISQSYWEVKNRLAAALAQAKRQKIQELIGDPDNWLEPLPTKPSGSQILCPSCHLPLIPENWAICDFCENQKRIGEKLPKAQWLLFLPSGQQETFKDDLQALWIDFGPLGGVVIDTADRLAQWRGLPLYDYQAVNRFGAGSAAFAFFAQSLPVARQKMTLESERDDENEGEVKLGQVLSFSTLAEMSTGDRLLGILKMDVDRLGALFTHGLGPVATPLAPEPDLRSIARLATLSRMFSWFFQHEINRQCEDVFQEWREASGWASRQSPANPGLTNQAVNQIFYTVFAGGDDLLLVGPWDQVLKLSQQIRAAFKQYATHNPNLTISGGLFICKPKYPINLSAEEAEAALKRAKEQGRNRLTVFGEVAVWDLESDQSLINQTDWSKVYLGFEDQELRLPKTFPFKKLFDPHTFTLKELLGWGEELGHFLDNHKIPRRFLHALLRARRSFFPPSGGINLMLLPFLHYQMERNIKDPDVRDALKKQLITGGRTLALMRQVRLPVSFVLTKTRRR